MSVCPISGCVSSTTHFQHRKLQNDWECWSYYTKCHESLPTNIRCDEQKIVQISDRVQKRFGKVVSTGQ